MIKDSVLITAGIQQGLLDPERVAKVKVSARRERKELLQALSFSERFPVASLYRAYAELHHFTFITGKMIRPDQELIKKLPSSLVERRLIVPLRISNATNEILLAVANPEDKAGIEQARRILNKPVQICLAEPGALAHAISHSKSDVPAFLTEIKQEDSFDPVAELDAIFKEAYLNYASDIHMEPQKDYFQVRMRVDGRLQDYHRVFSLSEGAGLMSRMKVMVGMDISEQRMAQDGSMTYQLDENIEFDVRAATLPTRFAERATLRILGAQDETLTLEDIGMSAQALSHFRTCINKPHGIILITGPTGSGKSTTLYSALQEIASDDINILTVEDPVEYVIEGVSQVQVSSKISFAETLRSFLRHDPDVIMVGEIRDGETASVAMKAAMTGHLVFSTLHTNSALSTINRLVDIGAERFLVGASLLCVIAQRLVRRLCSHCKKVHPLTEQEFDLLGITEADDVKVYEAVGCANCMGTGYRGRIALFETLWVDSNLVPLISQGADETTLQREAQHFYSLAEDGRSKVVSGLTSLEEIARLALIEATGS